MQWYDLSGQERDRFQQMANGKQALQRYTMYIRRANLGLPQYTVDETSEVVTAYGVFVGACWAQHKRQYSDNFLDKEIEELNNQCLVWWYNLSEEERDRFQEMADRSNAQQALNQSYRTGLTQNTINSTSAGDVPSFTYSMLFPNIQRFGAQSAGGQVINAAVN